VKISNIIGKPDSSGMLNYERFDRLIEDNIVYSHHASQGKIAKVGVGRKKTDFLLKEKEEMSLNMTTEKSVEEKEEKKEEVKQEVKEEQNLAKEKSIVQNDPFHRKETIVERSLPERKQFLSRLKKVLSSSLTYLYENNISIYLYFTIHPFPKTPFSKASKSVFKAESRDFFEEVKLGNDKKVMELLLLDKYLLFEFDYFLQTGYHWAAKRGLKSTLELLTSFGNHINLYDLNKRTPLFLAAKNNHLDVCKYLLEKGANPFLKSSGNKRAIDVCSDETIKRVLKVNMDNINIVNKWADTVKFHRTLKSEDNNKKSQENSEY
jgi:hypothetical protein